MALFRQVRWGNTHYLLSNPKILQICIINPFLLSAITMYWGERGKKSLLSENSRMGANSKTRAFYQMIKHGDLWKWTVQDVLEWKDIAIPHGWQWILFPLVSPSQTPSSDCKEDMDRTHSASFPDSPMLVTTFLHTYGKEVHAHTETTRYWYIPHNRLCSLRQSEVDHSSSKRFHLWSIHTISVATLILDLPGLNK